MISILQPFAERVRELQGQMGELSKNMSSTCMEVDQHKTKLHHHEVRLSATFSKNKESNDQAQAMRTELEAAQRELSDLRSSHGAMKASLGQAEADIQTTSSIVQALKHELQDSSAKVGELQSGSANVAKRLEESIEKRLDNLQNFYKEVHDRQFDTQKALQQANTFAGVTSQKLDTLTRSCSQKWDVDAANFATLSDRSDGLETRLIDVSKAVQQHTDRLRSMSEESESLKNQTLQLVNPEQLRVHLKELRLSLDDLDQRAQKSEDSIAEIIFDSTSEKRGLENLIRKVEQKVDKNASDILHLEELDQVHSNSLRNADQRATNFESSQLKLRERADACEKEVRCERGEST